MSAPLVFVDTPLLIYSEDLGAGERQARALAWLDAIWRRRCGRLSTQVLSEFYDRLTRHLSPAMPMGDARAEVRRYQHWQPWQIDHQTVETAWAMEARFALGWWDALVVAAAIHQDCRYLLSVDLAHERQIDSVRVINPFLAGPELLDAD